MVPATLDILGGIADLLARENSREQAVELLALVQEHPASSGETRSKTDRRLADLADELLADLIETVKARGQTVDWQGATLNALNRLVEKQAEL